MKKISDRVLSSLRLITVLTIFAGMVTTNLAQQVVGLSVGYHVFPYVKLADPVIGVEDMEIQTQIKTIGAAFPLMFQDGKIMVLNQLSYRKVEFQYKNVAEGDNIASDLDRAISINYTAFMLDSLSEKWTMVAVLVPGLASDFKADKITSDDFTLQAIFGYIRKYSKQFQLGIGLAYMRDFGRPLPMPFVYFDWNNGDKLSASGLVPMDMTAVYKLNPKIDIMLAFKIFGDRHHGDPDIFNDVKNPQLEYSEGTLSPSINIHLKQWLHIGFEAGYAAYRNLRFLDGDKEKGSYDLEKTAYYRANLVLGI